MVPPSFVQPRDRCSDDVEAVLRDSSALRYLSDAVSVAYRLLDSSSNSITGSANAEGGCGNPSDESAGGAGTCSGGGACPGSMFRGDPCNRDAWVRANAVEISVAGKARENIACR